MWSIVPADLLGTPRGWAPYRGLKITRKLDGAATVAFGVDADDEAAGPLEVAATAILGYQDGQLRFKGKIDDPLEDTEDLVSVVAKDPFGWLAHRRVHLPTTYTSTDAGLIAWGLINAQNGRVGPGGVLLPTRLGQGTIDPSVARDRAYEVGKPVDEAIRELAEVDDGFWFYVLPYHDKSHINDHGTFEVRWPESGTDRPDVKFEFGADTLANIETYKRTRTRPITGARATGISDGETTLTSYQFATQDALLAYDLIEEEASYPTVSVQATLDEHARGLLRPTPGSTFQFSPTAAGAALNPTEAPRLYVDFDVGDTCRLTIHYGRVQESDIHVRILEATIEISDDTSDEERLTGMVFEVVA